MTPIGELKYALAVTCFEREQATQGRRKKLGTHWPEGGTYDGPAREQCARRRAKIIPLVLKGLSHQEIGRRLGVPKQTIHNDVRWLRRNGRL